MFGFLQAPIANCCGGTPKIWRSHFCGLATRMHHDFGPWARFLVNRDSTFLALAGAPTDGGQERLTTCCNPFATPSPLIDTGRHMEYAADITLCALSIKLRDDTVDEGWSRRLLAKVSTKTLEPAIDRAIARLNSSHFPTSEVEETILSQSELESHLPHAVEAAQPTASAYGRIFQQHPGSHSSLWQGIGQSLGRLIYWDDAWNDWAKDQQLGRFNPLSQTPLHEFRELMAHEFTHFQQQLATLPTSPQQSTLLQVASQTQARLPLADEHPDETKKRQRKRKREETRDHWWNDCCTSCDCFGCCPCDL